jgi:hypothetical protein
MRGMRRVGHSIRRPSPYELLALAGAALALSSVAYAAIPSADGTIKGCYASKNGLLLGIPYSKGDVRIVDEAEGCRSYEMPIGWNQGGQQDGVAAYARIQFNGTVDPGASKGIDQSNVSLGAGVGEYCVNGLPFQPGSAIAQSAFSHPTAIGTAQAETGSAGCQVFVQTRVVSQSSGPEPFAIPFTAWIVK